MAEEEALTLRGMALGTRPGAEPSVRIVTRQNVVNGELAIELVELAEMSEGGHGAVEKARICFAPLIALYRAVGQLQPQQDCKNAREEDPSVRAGQTC